MQTSPSGFHLNILTCVNNDSISSRVPLNPLDEIKKIKLLDFVDVAISLSFLIRFGYQVVSPPSSKFCFCVDLRLGSFPCFVRFYTVFKEVHIGRNIEQHSTTLTLSSIEFTTIDLLSIHRSVLTQSMCKTTLKLTFITKINI